MNVIIHDGPVTTGTVFSGLYDNLTDFCLVCQFPRTKVLEMLVNSILNNYTTGRYETVLPMLLRVNPRLRCVTGLRVSDDIEDGAYTACLVMQVSDPSWVATLDGLGFMEFKGGEGELSVTLSVEGLIPANCVPQELTVTPRFSYRRAAWNKLKSVAATFRRKEVTCAEDLD
jgi:hypothetical protein